MIFRTNRRQAAGSNRLGKAKPWIVIVWTLAIIGIMTLLICLVPAIFHNPRSAETTAPKDTTKYFHLDGTFGPELVGKIQEKSGWRSDDTSTDRSHTAIEISISYTGEKRPAQGSYVRLVYPGGKVKVSVHNTEGDSAVRVINDLNLVGTGASGRKPIELESGLDKQVRDLVNSNPELVAKEIVFLLSTMRNKTITPPPGGVDEAKSLLDCLKSVGGIIAAIAAFILTVVTIIQKMKP